MSVNPMTGAHECGDTRDSSRFQIHRHGADSSVTQENTHSSFLKVKASQRPWVQLMGELSQPDTLRDALGVVARGHGPDQERVDSFWYKFDVRSKCKTSCL